MLLCRIGFSLPVYSTANGSDNSKRMTAISVPCQNYSSYAFNTNCRKIPNSPKIFQWMQYIALMFFLHRMRGLNDALRNSCSIA